MKILFLINNLSRGGAEGVFAAEAEALSRLGYDTEIYELYPNNFKNIYDWSGYRALIKKIRKEKIGIVYSTLDDANFVAKFVRIFVYFKLFCREANMTEDKPRKFKLADIFLNFLVYKLVMVASAVKDSYASYDPYHASKMTVLYNGVQIPDVPREFRESYNPVRIMAVGSFTPKKGFEDLVSIFKDYIFPNNKNFLLEIVGEGVLMDKIKADIKNAGMSHHIRCPGLFDKEKLREHYKKAQVFVLTSKKEGCPNVLLEASSYGLAPVCFSVGAVPEIIENKVSGIYVPKGEKEKFGRALSELIENPKEINAMGNQARNVMKKKFTFALHMQNLLKTLELK